MAIYTFNGTTKRVTLPAGMVALDLVDLHSRWKEWVLAGNAECLLAFSTVGGDITEIPLYLFMLNGWLIVPQSANHSLTVTNGVLIGQASADPFTDPAGSFKIRINRQVPGIAIGYSTTGGTAAVIDYASIAAAVRQELTTELTRIDAAVSSVGGSTLTAADVWAYATRALTIAPSSLTAAQVRAALSPELARMDVAISSRLASGATVLANVKSIQGVAVTGAGTKADPWRPV